MAMNVPRLLVLLAFLAVLGVPLAFRPSGARLIEDPSAARVVIITPHNEQIRFEFKRAFERWHEEKYGERVVVDWRQPGGTGEIRKQLESIYRKAVATGQLIRSESGEWVPAPGAAPMAFDLFFGGGSYEHDQAKRGVSARPPGAEKDEQVPISMPAGFSQEQLDAWFGENVIGALPLYDRDQFWLGNALSGFGIVYNRDVLSRLGLPEPTSWRDLTDARYSGWLALADPRSSGSVTTTYDSILNNYGWDEGWRILRAMSANARYFSNSSPKVPIDVSQGEAAAGVAIDFYGRYQNQAVMRPGETPETSRVGYIDPPGVVLIDPDPISLLRAGPNPTGARRFIEFLLSEQGQALWQFHKGASAQDESGAPIAGPEKYELRRMPIRRVMYEKHRSRFVDTGIDPFAAASRTPSLGWRSAVAPLMAAFGIETHDDMRRAWEALNGLRASGRDPALAAELEALFHSFPHHTMKDGSKLPVSAENWSAIRADWRDAQSTGRWNRIRVEYAEYFRRVYRDITLRAAARG